MKEKDVKDLLNKIFMQVFGKSYDFTIDQVRIKFAFSLSLIFSLSTTTIGIPNSLATFFVFSHTESSSRPSKSISL